MVVFVYEFFNGGGLRGQQLQPSLCCEGFAMLASIIRDFSGIQGAQVVTMIDQRAFDNQREAVQMLPAQIRVVNPANERSVFQQLCRASDYCLLIAPETAGILADRCRIADAESARRLGCLIHAIELTSDKLATAARLCEQQIPAVTGVALELSDRDSRFADYPAVLKPRDGAGTELTYFIQSAGALESIMCQARIEGLGRKAVLQPFVSGESVSVACLVGSESIVSLPACEQRLSIAKKLSYLGGAGPIRGPLRDRAQRLAERAVRAIPGLRGYVGVDMILADEPQDDVVVEINPRLTTSYLVLRELVDANLTSCLLQCVDTQPCPVRLKDEQRWAFCFENGAAVVSRESYV